VQLGSKVLPVLSSSDIAKSRQRIKVWNYDENNKWVVEDDWKARLLLVY